MEKSSSGTPRITFEQAQEIRASYTGRRGEQSELALRFGVSQAAVWNIVNNKTHVRKIVALTADQQNARRREKRRELDYGVTNERWQQMLVEAEYACETCGGKLEDQALHPRTGEPFLNLDHNHETGAPRGVLCSGCNKTLGFVKDSPELLRKLAEYLEKYL